MVLCGYFSSISWGSYSDSLMWPSWRHRSDSLIRWVFRWYVGYTALQYLTWWVKKGSWEIVGKSLLDSLQLCNSQDFYRPFGVKIIAWSKSKRAKMRCAVLFPATSGRGDLMRSATARKAMIWAEFGGYLEMIAGIISIRFNSIYHITGKYDISG
jgi:hypothetical protein